MEMKKKKKEKRKSKKKKIVHNIVVLSEKNVLVFTKKNFILSILYFDIIFM